MARSVPSRWGSVILVCSKCTRRVEGGFGTKGRKPLAQVLRKAGLGGRGRKADRGIVETGCLKLCPKRAVVAVDSRRPDRWLLVAPGTPTDMLVEIFDGGAVTGGSADAGRSGPAEPDGDIL